MTKFVGRLLKVGVGRETARGTGVVPAYQVPFATFSFDDKVVLSRSSVGLGILGDSEAKFVGTKYGAGDLEGELRANSFGVFLYGLLGTCTSGGVVDSSYTHSFTVNNIVQGTSLSLTVTDPNTTEVYKLVTIDTLEIDATLEDIVSFSISFLGKQGVVSGHTIPALTAEKRFTKKMVTMKLADSIAGLAAASEISLKGLKIKFSKGAVLDDVLGTVEPEDILSTVLSIEGELTINYESETYKNYMRAGTYKCMQIKFENGDDLIGVSTKPALTMQFPRVDFLEWEADYSLDKPVTQKFSFKCNRDVTNSLDLISSCQLVNTVVSY